MVRNLASYREHIRVMSDSTKRLFEISYRSFADIEELIDSQPSDEQVYDYLQAWINGLQERKRDPNTIKLYFCHIKQYLHYRGVKMNPLDIKQCLKFPTKHEEEKRPLDIPTFHQILERCSHKRRMLYLAQSSSGMRIGEITQLRKKDIHTDMKRMMIKIPAKITKKRRGRTTFFSTEAAKLIMPRLKELDDEDLVFGTNQDPQTGVVEEITYLRRLLQKMGINDKYETTGRNVITTHSFRAFFITKLSRHDPNLAKHFTGQKGYLLQYDRLSDEERLEYYMKYEPHLLVSDTSRHIDKIKSLEENAMDRDEIYGKYNDLRRRMIIQEKFMDKILMGKSYDEVIRDIPEILNK